MENIKDILMHRDGMSAEDADYLMQEAIEAMNEYLESGDEDGAYNICEEYFGLEPDYLMELV